MDTDVQVHRSATVSLPADDPTWWRDAVIYQVYVRSFADGDGDGTGDLAGVRARLPYLRDLGVDAIWFNPWYPSPLADGGYDVADYRDIHPRFGTLREAELLIAEALALGIRTIIDIVPNHISDQHPWFQEALAAAPGSPARERFWFRPGRGEHGEQMPTRWESSFQGDTWTRTTNPDGTPGEWYLHLFTPEQPDLNWNHPDVRREHEDILRFWFDRGVAGVRIDSAALPAKDPDFPEVPAGRVAPGTHPHLDRDELHDIYRSWRAVADEYDGTRILVGEVWLDDAERFARYLRSDEMHTAFNFDFMTQPFSAGPLRASIERTLAEHAPVGAPATWVLSNHDVTRPVTRYGRADSGFAFTRKRFGTPTDLARGTRRARAAALLVAALPGSMYIYQGDELGLPEAEVPLDRIEDPMHFRSGGVDPGRDGCRVPLPWSGTRPPYGFGPAGRPDVATSAPAPTPAPATSAPAPIPTGAPLAPTAPPAPTAAPDTPAAPWLPQPEGWAPYTVEAQQAAPDSMLHLYRDALALRRSNADLRTERLAWLELGADVLAFRRGDHLASVTNFGPVPIRLPAHHGALLASAPLTDDTLPPDATVWLEL